MELFAGIIINAIVLWKCTTTERNFDNYTPPKGQTIDYNKQSLDKVKNHLTNEQVMKNTISGKYNKKDFL